jgi:[acyl-carrier-protein] S-malonyltransferase
MIDFRKTAFLFPGQGSQVVGMGQDLAAAYSVARQTFQEADDVLGMAFSRLCFEGPEAELNDTLNTQPALYICGVATLRVLQAELDDVTPLAAAGHSLGEFTALTAAGALGFADGVRLVRERARLMAQAGEQHPGGMAALLGMEADPVRAICAEAARETGGVLVLANDNCPGQLVISGDVPTLERGMALATAAGCKRVVRVNISIAAHSPLMAAAAAQFNHAIANTPLHLPHLPIYANVSTQPLRTVEDIHHELSVQLTESVHWTGVVQRMIADGAEHFFELGPKDVLSGLLKRIDRSKSSTPINSAAAVAALIAG